MAEVITPDSLREQLRRLEVERRDHHEARAELDQRTAAVLIDVWLTPGITITEAAQLLGTNRQNCYRLLETAGGLPT